MRTRNLYPLKTVANSLHLSTALPGKKRERNAPLKTGKELAEEFGISPATLGKLVNYDQNAPGPNFVTKKHIWYDPVAMRLWWQSRNSK